MSEANESPELPKQSLSPFLKGEKKSTPDLSVDPNYPEGYDPAQTFKTDPETGKFLVPAKRLHKNPLKIKTTGRPHGRPPKNGIAAQYRPTKNTLSANGLKIGRPRKYSDEELTVFADELIDWFNASEDRDWIPDFFLERGISKQRMYEYANRVLSFAENFALCKDGAESRIVKRIFNTKYSAVATAGIMTLKQTAGWRDKMEITDTRQQVREVSLSVVTPEGTVTDGTLKYGQAQNGEDSRKESPGLQESTISK